MSGYFHPLLELSGKVERVLLGMQSDSIETTPMEQAQVTWDGLENDKHAGRTRPADSRTPQYPRGTPILNDRQVCIVSAEELAAIACDMDIPAIEPEWLGANILASGIPSLTRLPPGTRLVFSGGTVLYITHFNNPCSLPGKTIQANHPDRDDLVPAFVRNAQHRRGLVAMVERPGTISTGDTIQVITFKHYVYLDDAEGGTWHV
jgi:MOSC domain-containing protein YiiM